MKFIIGSMLRLLDGVNLNGFTVGLTCILDALSALVSPGYRRNCLWLALPCSCSVIMAINYIWRSPKRDDCQLGLCHLPCLGRLEDRGASLSYVALSRF